MELKTLLQKNISRVVILATSFFMLSCASTVADFGETESSDNTSKYYLIGPGDVLNVFVWGNSELSVTIPVRPDGRITTPLVEDVVASGKTSSQLARDMERRLSRFIKKPVVTISVTTFVGRSSEQIRIVGEVTTPKTIPFSADLTLLDVMISVGGLTEYASGNNATIARKIDNRTVQFRVRIDDLTKDGDISANVEMLPGDVLFVPESFF